MKRQTLFIYVYMKKEKKIIPVGGNTFVSVIQQSEFCQGIYIKLFRREAMKTISDYF